MKYIGRQFGVIRLYYVNTMIGPPAIATATYGEPQDDIDRSCQDFKKCYKCLLDEHEDDSGLL